MPVHCAIVSCSNTGGRDKKSFYRVPKVITNQGEDTKGKTERRRRLWIAAINRADVQSYEYFRVCSDHFISGNPHPYDETNPDWVPNKNLGYERPASPSKAAQRHERRKNRTEFRKKEDAALSLLELSSYLEEDITTDLCSTDPHLQESDCDKELSDVEKLELANRDIAGLKDENKKLREENECLKNIVHKMKATGPEDFQDSDKVKYYTGLPSHVTLMALFNLLAPRMSDNRNTVLTKFQRIIVTLMRLRLNLPVMDLSYRFGVSKTTISRAFMETLNHMYLAFQPFVRWPDRDELHETMPMVFRKNFGRRVTCIIDCFELFIDRPSNMTARAQTWSNYKHHNTAKYLIGITPQGTVSFISEGWGGRTSDKFLTANCKFLDNLINGDLLLADRGFNIEEVVALVGAEVKFPTFMRGKQQLSGPEVESTRKIANVRIHVERVIGTVRQKFQILGATSPIDYLISKPGDKCVALDKIVFVCCALTNMCPSVLPFD